MWTGEIREWYILNGTLHGKIYNSKNSWGKFYGKFYLKKGEYYSGEEFPNGTNIAVDIFHFPDPGRIEYLPYLSYLGLNLIEQSLNNYFRLTCCDVDGWYWDLKQIWCPPLHFKVRLLEEIILTEEGWKYKYSDKEKEASPLKIKKQSFLDWGIEVTSTPYGPKYPWNVKDYREFKMTNIETDPEEKDKNPLPQPNLRSITGGRDGEGNWLAGLKEKSVFTCISKDNRDGQVVQFHLMKVWGRSCWLMSNFPAHQQGNFLFHMLKFSQQHDLVDLLQDGDDDGTRRQDEEGKGREGSLDVSSPEDS